MKMKILYPKFSLIIVLAACCWLSSSVHTYGQIPAYIPTSGLRAWYPFNGNPNDSSGYGYNGVAYGGITYGTDRFGVANHSLRNHEDGSINIPHHIFPLRDSSRSVSVFFKWDTSIGLSVPRQFIAWGNNTLGGRFGLIAKDSSIGIEFTGGYAYTHFRMDTFWHSMIVTYSTGGAYGLKLYIDGNLISSLSYLDPVTVFNTDTGTFHNIAGSTYYGSYYTDAWAGFVDDAAVWSRVLTPCEVWQIAHSTIVDTTGAGTITGATVVCTGSTTTLHGDTTGGSWSSWRTSVATVDATTGIVTGVATGTDTIIYTYTGVCGTTTAKQAITVTSTPDPGVISGIDKVCPGDSITLTDSIIGGTWSSSDTSIATISVYSGVVYGVAAGSSTITYTMSLSCGTAFTTLGITVFPSPNAGSIIGPSDVCTGTAITLTDTASGGTWAASNGNVAFTGGIITGLHPGFDSIFYSVTTLCGTDSALHIMTIDTAPSAGTIAIIESSICPGDTIRMNDAATGGTWISENTAIASITGSGLATGVAGGTDTVFYIVSNACGSDTAVATLSVLSATVCHEGIKAVSELSIPAITVYPDPNNGEFVLKLSGMTEKTTKVIITNVLGEVVSDFQAQTNEDVPMHLDVSSGFYFISTTVNSQKVTTKMIAK